MEGKQNSRVWINGPASQETTVAKLLLLYKTESWPLHEAMVAGVHTYTQS